LTVNVPNEITDDNDIRVFDVFTPDVLDPDTQYPVVFAMHDFRTSKDELNIIQNYVSGTTSTNGTEFILVCPQGGTHGVLTDALFQNFFGGEYFDYGSDYRHWNYNPTPMGRIFGDINILGLSTDVVSMQDDYKFVDEMIDYLTNGGE
jgi:hypothetical protein